jgi:hypothetical protein
MSTPKFVMLRNRHAIGADALPIALRATHEPRAIGEAQFYASMNGVTVGLSTVAGEWITTLEPHWTLATIGHVIFEDASPDGDVSAN